MNESKALTNKSVVCANCRSMEPMWKICEGDYPYTTQIPMAPDDFGEVYFGKATWQVLVCQICESPNILQRYEDHEGANVIGHDHEGDEIFAPIITDRRLFPPRDIELPLPHPNMPEGLIEDYEEAMDVFSVSARSSCALLRLVIQKLCKELGKPGKTINDDIASLVKDGLEAGIQKRLDIVRVVGNESVHPGELDVLDDPKIARKLFELVNDIIEDRFEKPKKEAEVEELYQRLPKPKRDAITVRDENSKIT